MSKKIKHRTIQDRKALRNLARYNMKKAGYEHLNDRKYIDPETGKMMSGRSIFARNWRKFAVLDN